MTRNEREERRAHEARLQRHVLEAAAARPDEVPPPSPFLEVRLRARIAAAQQSGGAAGSPAGVGALAWRVVPVLALCLALLSVWTGVETARAARAQDEAVTALVETGDLVGEVLGDEPQDLREDRP